LIPATATPLPTAGGGGQRRMSAGQLAAGTRTGPTNFGYPYPPGRP
jgi:hypothetical protein